MSYDVRDWYWAGQPEGQASPIVYSSKRAALVAEDDADYVAWQGGGANIATPWPPDETGAKTIAALDAVLTAAGRPATGLAVPSIAQLQAQTKAAASDVCNGIVSQILPDQVHQNAYNLAASMCGATATPPLAEPVKTAFDGLAAQYGLQPQAFATMVVAITAAALQLRGIQQALETAASIAASPADLKTALDAFEASIAALVAFVNAALAGPITAPPAIVIAGVNA